MLATLILNISPKVSSTIFKSSVIGLASPNDSPYDSLHKKTTSDAYSPYNPPITNPDNKNTSNIHIFFSLVATFIPPFFLRKLNSFVFLLII